MTRPLQRLWAAFRQWRLRPRPRGSTRRLGRLAEQAAARWLRRRGYRIVERNLRLPGGEIDLLACREGWLVVVEVRSRKQGSAVSPRETLTAKKKRRLRRLAEQVHKRPRWRRLSLRIDLVEVETDTRDRVVSIQALEAVC